MNPRRLLCAFLGLAGGLLFYLAYRSEHTVSNQLLRTVFGPAQYVAFKQGVRAWLPIPAALRDSLPSALWCFIVASLLGGWKLPAGRGRSLSLAAIGPVFNAGWEIVQGCGWTNGRADWRDAVAGIAGWAVAELLFRHSDEPVEIPLRWGWRTGVVVAGFACMGLAHVWK